ncbi:MAG TPA: imidazole glycerol phosphate synthase subunit HisH [Nocardioidaceae bacterium]|nr:imidazole glycerol phosphate synthase subunit HisH [Nocardioidaceae bacterium]
MTGARPRVVVADSGSGNLRSIEKVLVAVGADAVVTADADTVAGADKLVVPGQGAFGACAVELDQRGGALRQAVLEVIRSGRPFFGICVGMQLLFESSEESPAARGLGILPGRVRRFVERPGLKIPHMGWNRTARGPARSTSVREVPDGDFFYFVHSYYPDPARAEDVALTSEHGGSFVAAVARDNVFGCQFHPEKSQAAGQALLRQFVAS